MEAGSEPSSRDGNNGRKWARKICAQKSGEDGIGLVLVGRGRFGTSLALAGKEALLDPSDRTPPWRSSGFPTEVRYENQSL